MLTSTVIAAATAPLEWSPAIGILMIVANIIAITFGKFSIKYPSSEPALPSSNLFGGFGLPGLLATTAFGHILGVGIILGLHYLGRF